MTHLEGHRSAQSVTGEQKREAISIAPLSHHAWLMVFLEKAGVAMLLSCILEVEGGEIPGFQHSFYRPLPPNANGGPLCIQGRVGNCKQRELLLSDAFTDRFDVALLISADSDLVGPIQKVRHLFPEKRMIAVFPPARHSNALKNVAHACLHLDRATLIKSVFPDQVTKPDGFAPPPIQVALDVFHFPQPSQVFPGALSAERRMNTWK